jgi:N4-(beta-N-acetylglucosaminyl)-L-asparaginase
MRQGMKPKDACKEAVRRIVNIHPKTHSQLQIGFIALRKDGEIGAFGMRNNEFSYSLTDANHPNGTVIKPESWLS